ncbi:MAG: transposase zinc-binding domain-containing protein, partial [Phaeodactylibacter sp.]|nr:transposase zinc-binding domain-containing protein [Phaeodactylibacter sp.]
SQVHSPMQVLSETSTASHCGHGNHLPDGHTIGQLFRDYGEEYIRVYGASRQTIKLIRSIRVCRTPALGGRRITCKQCGDVRYQYFSCGNSQCPQCQGIKRLQWQDRTSA